MYTSRTRLSRVRQLLRSKAVLGSLWTSIRHGPLEGRESDQLWVVVFQSHRRPHANCTCVQIHVLYTTLPLHQQQPDSACAVVVYVDGYGNTRRSLIAVIG